MIVLTAFSDWLNQTFYNFDDSIFRFFNQLEQSMPWLYKLARFISFFGDEGIFFIAICVVFLIFRKTRKTGIGLAIGLIIGWLLCNLILKYSIARPRPFASELSPYYEMWKNAGGTYLSSYSFPSGHTNVSAVFGIYMFLAYDKKYSWTYLLIPIFMGLSRIMLFVHYPTDVIGGLITGAISAISAYFIVKPLYKINFIEKLTTGDKLF